MSRLVAYFGSDPERLACALAPARTALYARTVRGEGWGLGFVQGGDVLLQKRPRAESDEIDFFGLAKDLRAEAFVGRVGAGDLRGTPVEDADPFRCRSWLFASQGQSAGFEIVREKLLESVPDFLRRNVRGRSPSEHVFHLFLAFLHDGGLLDQPSPSPEAVQRALHASVSYVDRLLAAAGSQSTQLDLVATNGRCLVAAARAGTLQYLEITGISDCQVCRAQSEIEGDGRRVAHDSLRAIVLESHSGNAERAGWQTIPAGASLVIGADRIPHVA